MRCHLIKLIFPLLCALFLFSSCQSINSSREKMDIPLNSVYFSFDDGPNAHNGTTERLLEVLDKYQIKALFFLLGENAEQYPDLAKLIYEKGHFIASHGYHGMRHAYKMSDEEFRSDILRAEEAFFPALGHSINPKLYRPHGGYYTSRQEKIAGEEGYLIVPVTVRVYDAVLSAADRKKIVKKTVNLVKKRGGGLVLLHDARDSYSLAEAKLEKNPNGAFNRSFMADAVEEIIIALLEKGFNLSGDILSIIIPEKENDSFKSTD